MSNKPDSKICEWYFKTIFEIPLKPNQYPRQFAIITAHNPFNKLLNTQENIARNHILKNDLKRNYGWVYEINGFDEQTNHKENGFMFDAKSLDEACHLGLKYSQDAIYYVIDDILYVSKSDIENRKLIEVGEFLIRIR